MLDVSADQPLKISINKSRALLSDNTSNLANGKYDIKIKDSSFGCREEEGKTELEAIETRIFDYLDELGVHP